MVNNTMYWGVVIQGDKPADPWLTIGPLATMKEAEAYRKFACPYDIGIEKAHVINIVPRNEYGAPDDNQINELKDSVYPFETEEYNDGDEG